MSTQYNSIQVGEQSFNIRTSFNATVLSMEGREFKHIQHLLVELFSSVEDVHSDEYALMVYMHFPKSSIVNNRRHRAIADVRKYNNGDFAIQEAKPDTQVRLLDGGTRSGGSDSLHVQTAMASIKEQLRK